MSAREVANPESEPRAWSKRDSDEQRLNLASGPATGGGERRLLPAPDRHIRACGQPASTELLKLTDYVFERSRGVARRHLCEVAKNHLSFGGRLPVRFVTACCDPREQQINRCAEQGGVVELRIEPSLFVLHPATKRVPPT